MLCFGPFQNRSNPHHLVKVTWTRPQHPSAKRPTNNTRIRDENHHFLPDSMFIYGAEKAFSSKAKLWSLWSVGRVAEEMLIMRLCTGLVCCDLEGSSYGAVGLRGMRGVTTGTAPGREKPQTLSNCARSLPSTGLAHTNTFPESQDFIHILHCVSISLTTP